MGDSDEPPEPLSDQESLQKVASGESSAGRSRMSDRSKSSASLNVQSVANDEVAKVQLKKEVGAWWGRKCAD
jgi:hypothetical protein